jgi:hypothetical protein
MPLHIKDSATNAAVRELAHNRRMTLTEACASPARRHWRGIVTPGRSAPGLQTSTHA